MSDERQFVREHRVIHLDPDPPLEEAVRQVRAEFLEMPGLQLTIPQAARLWAFDADFCTEVLALLVEARFLVRLRDTFIRPEGRS